MRYDKKHVCRTIAKVALDQTRAKPNKIKQTVRSYHPYSSSYNCSNTRNRLMHQIVARLWYNLWNCYRTWRAALSIHGPQCTASHYYSVNTCVLLPDRCTKQPVPAIIRQNASDRMDAYRSRRGTYLKTGGSVYSHPAASMPRCRESTSMASPRVVLASWAWRAIQASSITHA